MRTAFFILFLAKFFKNKNSLFETFPRDDKRKRKERKGNSRGEEKRSVCLSVGEIWEIWDKKSVCVKDGKKKEKKTDNDHENLPPSPPPNPAEKKKYVHARLLSVYTYSSIPPLLKERTVRPSVRGCRPCRQFIRMALID